MAISIRGTATSTTPAADTSSPYSSTTYTLPTGVVANDLLVCLLGVKWQVSGTYSAAQTTPTDYTLAAWRNNGTAASTNGGGSVWVQIAYKVHDGSEANPTQNYSGGYTPSMPAMIAFQNGLGGWDVTATTAAKSNTTSPFTTATTDTPPALSPNPTTLDYTTGDWLGLLIMHKDDTATETAPPFTAPEGIFVPGCTLGTITERLPTNTTITGLDASMYFYTAPISSGTATGPPRAQINVLGTSMGDGAAIFLRIREVAPPETSIESWGFLPIS